MENSTIRFKEDKSTFYDDVIKRISDFIQPNEIKKSHRLIQVKTILYLTFYLGIYLVLFQHWMPKHFLVLLCSYILIGLLGLLLSFNCGHDAAHGTFSRHRVINQLIFYFIFNSQGVNSRLWKIRHLNSHHLFPNVDGCDADIDQNKMMRLSPNHPTRKIYEYQHIYAIFLYLFYTLHWIVIKDFMYLRKKELANLKNLNYSFWFVLETILLKVVYVVSLVVIPAYYSEYSFLQVFTAFLLMHGVISICFVFSLAISHLSEKATFATIDSQNELSHNFFEHQLAVSVDFHPSAKWANWVFGGFNAHAAHHLFPSLPHTLYPKITSYIEQVAHEYGYRYNKLSFFKAIRAHMNYLYLLGRNKPVSI